MSAPTTLRRSTLITVVAIAVLTGCVTENRPPDEVCAQPALTIPLAITSRGLEPETPAACRGQLLTLQVTIDEAAVFHVHGYDAVAVELTPDRATPIEFTADRAGQFPIEIHPAVDASAVEIGILTIHEP